MWTVIMMWLAMALLCICLSLVEIQRIFFLWKIMSLIFWNFPLNYISYFLFSVFLDFCSLKFTFSLFSIKLMNAKSLVYSKAGVGDHQGFNSWAVLSVILLVGQAPFSKIFCCWLYDELSFCFPVSKGLRKWCPGGSPSNFWPSKWFNARIQESVVSRALLSVTQAGVTGAMMRTFKAIQGCVWESPGIHQTVLVWGRK